MPTRSGANQLAEQNGKAHAQAQRETAGHAREFPRVNAAQFVGEKLAFDFKSLLDANTRCQLSPSRGGSPVVPGVACGIVSMRGERPRGIQIADIRASRPGSLAANRCAKPSTENVPGPRIRISSPTNRKIKGSAL